MSDDDDYSGSDAGDPVEELERVFASGDVSAIVKSILTARADLVRDAPETVHSFFADALPEAWRKAERPYALLLQLLDRPELLRKAGDKVDLTTALVRALKRLGDEDTGDAEQDAEEMPSATLPAELTPQLVDQAKALCLREAYLAPRAFEAVAKLYRIPLIEAELLAYANGAFAGGLYRECAEVLRAFHIESEAFPHALLLAHLASDKQCMDVLTAYLTQSPAFLQRHVHAALTHLAEYPKPGAVFSVAEPRPGNDPNAAAKLALKLGFPLSEFPRIVYLKLCDVVWWTCRIGKTRDFGLLLCDSDHALQRKLIKELIRQGARSGFADQVLAASFIEHWSHQLEVAEHRTFFDQMGERWKLEKDQFVDQDDAFMRDLEKAIALDQETPSSSALAGTPSLLLPALPAAVGASTLPQLFLRPSSITMVDSLESLAEARTHLLSPACRIVGVDLEHLPENLDKMHIRPTLCQLLQISCKARVFLFDLQVMYLPDEAAVQTEDVAAAASSSSTPATPSRIFPPLPVSRVRYTPTSPELAAGLGELLLTLFLDSEVLKVGIGFAQDLRKLRADFPLVAAFQYTLQHYADLTPLLRLVPDPDAAEREVARKRALQQSRTAAVARKAAVKAAAQKPGETASSSPPLPESLGGYSHASKKEGGLSKLVRMVLRRHLDKSAQCSNWNLRPLSMPQQQYAALDSVACVDIYEAAQRRGIELEAENIESTPF